MKSFVRTPVLALVIALSVPQPSPAQDQIQLPDFGSSASTVLSPRQEQALGEAFMRQLRQHVEIVDHPEVNDYIQSLGNRLLSRSGPLPYPYHFFVVADDSINAFAAPGGYIGIHSGLLITAQAESELAGVLAHEIAHLTQRHLARALEAAQKLNLPIAAAMLAAVLVGTQNPEAGQAALISLHAGSLQQQINFTRQNEREADNIGMQVLHESGFDPAGMPIFFERLSRASRYLGSKPPEFLSTHPVTTERIAESRARAGELGATRAQDPLPFLLTRARLKVLTEVDPRQALAGFSVATKDDPAHRAAALFGQALAHIRLNDLQAAQRLLQGLHRDDPDRLAYRAALGDVEFKAGRYQGAVDLYQDALKVYPGNRTLTLYLAEALIHAGQPQRARTEIERALRNNDDAPPPLYRLLGRAAEASGQRVDSLAAMAEYHFRSGRTGVAVNLMETALRTGDLNFYQQARLEARLDQFKQAESQSTQKDPDAGNKLAG